MKGIVEGQEFTIASLSSSIFISAELNVEHPNQRVNLKFTKDCMFVSFEAVGENEVDIVGYVTGLDASKLMSLKEAMEMSEASDDEDYKGSECECGECEGQEEREGSEGQEEGEGREEKEEGDGSKGQEEGDGSEEKEEEEEEEREEEENNGTVQEDLPRTAVQFDRPVLI